ncbi:MAG: class I SAM-dependent methyltransferase [Alphaproteobacteria bacterium]|nr:class I SAM-dependent methyltransferase [Alphaproteobacteria bacterium]
MSDVTQANKLAWNASAPHHKNSKEWQRLVEGFATPGFSTFDETLTACLKDVGIEGRSVVQVCCNNGREVLSLRSHGVTRALGLDQSQAFIAQAEELNQIAKTDFEFLCADVYDLPSNLAQQFDIALITIGVLNWMPDLPRFFEVVAGLLAPGGHLVIYETHPILDMFEPTSDKPFEVANSYFRKDPYVDTAAIVYEGEQVDAVSESYWFPHTIGDVLNGCIAAGLQIAQFKEYPHSNREVEYDIYDGHNQQVPMCFTLIGRKI